MKSYVVLLIVAVSCLCSLAGEEFRVFMDEQGRSIMLKVVKCEPESDRVTVELENGRRMTVKISGFSKSDQDYITDWYKANELISDRNLKISTDEEVFSEREEEIIFNVSYDYGDTDQEKGGEQEYEEIGYIIEFENKSSFPILDARVEYKIYYEQGQRGAKEPEQKVHFGEKKLPNIDAGRKIRFKTDAVEILNERFTSRFTISSKPAEGDVHGIRCRLIVKLSEEQTLVREFNEPSGLSEHKYPWKE